MKKNKVSPNFKQRKVFEKVLLEGKSVGKAMREVGYSVATSVNPGVNMTNTKGWEILMEQYLPDKLLMKKHRELLNVPMRKRTYKKGDIIEEIEELDTNAVKSGLDMAYKLKGKYKDSLNPFGDNGGMVVFLPKKKE